MGPLLSNVESYWRLIGRLIYLFFTCPNLAYVVDILAQLMQDPREDH